MGIRHLWGVLEPYADRKPLSDLNGKVVCVDLAGWVCESMNITDYQIQPKMYLKQLFFRTSYLLLANITPIFIAEGETPELKYQVIAKRNLLQFMGARPKATQADCQTQAVAKNPKGRTRFNHILKQCEELITCLGIQTLQPPGEAEAYGAFLNSIGLIDGVISQDSDCFGYGARRVYRNFSVAQSGGVVDVYDMDKINQVGRLDMGQDKIIVMALLCGCDYCPDGVHGVGKEGVLKLINHYSNADILNVIQGWRYEKSKFELLQNKITDSSRCNTCGHLGKQISHTKKGCVVCGTSQGCKASVWKDDRMAIKNEIQIRTKALQEKDFPSTQIIHEFKKKLDPPKTFDRSWRQPNIVKFVKVMGRQLEWSEIYAFQKVLPLLTRWQLQQKNATTVSQSQKGFVSPYFIKKKRNPKAIPCYEIIWKDEYKYFSEIFPDEQVERYLLENENNLESLWTTIEPADLVDRVYPYLIEEFEAAKLAKKKTKTKRAAKSPSATGRVKKTKKTTKPSDSLNDFSGMQKELEAMVVTKKKETVPKEKKKPVAVRSIDKFLKAEIKNTSLGPADDSLLALPDCDVDADCENILDLSNLISGIVSRSPVVKRLQGHELVYAEFKEELPETEELPEPEKSSNHSLDDIDLLIMKKKPNPRHKRVNSLRTELLSSTPNAKGPSITSIVESKADRSSFFAPASENEDLFELSYNAMISNHGIVPDSEDEDQDEDEM